MKGKFLMESKAPNIFTFATSELSQDAFIGWLASWAQKSNHNHDEGLNETAVYFLNKMFDARNIQKPESYKKVEVVKQNKNIDVLIIINDEYAIIVEDKVNTSNHSNQLKRYFDEVKNKNFKPQNIIPIYFKTGDQSDYSDIEKKGYSRFSRQDFLNVLEHGNQLGVRNAIFIDYHKYLESIEKEVNSYATLPINEWQPRSRSWIGFFIELQKQLGEGIWKYVPNPGGGFMSFLWHWKEDKNCPKFLHLEEEKLCFKIEVTDKSKQAGLRNDWSYKLLNSEKKFGLDIQKPERLGKGIYMTVAVLGSDYRQTNKEGRIDIAATIAIFKSAERFMDTLCDNF